MPSTMLSLLSTALVLAGFVNCAPFEATKRTACPKYMVIEAPGLGDQYGYWTEPTTEQLLKAYAGGERYLLKTKPPSGSGSTTDFVDIIADGATASLEVVGTVLNNTLACPDIKFVLFGYSYGTIVQVLAMNDPALLRPPIAAVILYGNCFWHEGRREDMGTAKNGTSVCGAIKAIGTPPILEDVAADFCLLHDYLCTGAPYGASDNSHWSYRDSQWQTDAVNFAIKRLESGNNMPN